MSSYVTAQEFYGTFWGNSYFQPSGDCNTFSSTGDVQAFLDSISNLIDLYTGQRFATGSFEETVRIQATNVHYLNQHRVRSITSIEYYPLSIYSNGYAVDPVVIDPANYRFFPDGKIIFTNRLPAFAQMTFRYVAGPDTVPDQIKTACLMWAQAWAQAISVGAIAIPDGGAVTSVQFDKTRETYVDPRARYDDPSISIPVTVKGILDRYKLMK